MSFDTALAFVLQWEGGYSNHPDDPGGATNLGITQRTLTAERKANPDLGLPEGVKALRRSDAAKIYRRSYWDAVRGSELPPGIGLLVFDCAVNQGVSRATWLLQEALGVAVDGKIGPKTIAAAHAQPSSTLIREYAMKRAFAYIATGRMNVFGTGWFRRLFSAAIEAVKESRA